MSVYKRGGVWWFEFIFKGQRIRQSTRQGDRKVARQMDAAYRTALAKGDVGLFERKVAPELKEFAQRFIDYIQARCASKPRTIGFYAEKLARLLHFEPLRAAKLDRIDEALIETYVQHRRNQQGRKDRVVPATINRELATLRRLLRLACEWHVINRVPRIRLLPGERARDFVLSYLQERLYLEMAPQPLKDIALLLLGTGLRIGEVLNLEWRDVRLQPADGATYGYIHVRDGKSRSARRNVCLTARVRAVLADRAAQTNTPYVFPSGSGKPYLVTSLDHVHRRVRRLLRLPEDFVLHSLRHTMLTRLGEAGADAFTIMRIAGHSTVTVSQRYVHPSPESVERAFERLEALNEKLGEKTMDGDKGLLPPPKSPTVKHGLSVSH